MNKITPIIKNLSFLLSLVGLFTLIYDVGFTHKLEEIQVLKLMYFFIIFVGLMAVALRYFFKKVRPKTSVIPYDIALFSFLLYIVLHDYRILEANEISSMLFNNRHVWIYVAILLIFIRELSTSNFNFRNISILPAQLFILSFLGLIVMGSTLLLLPNATYHGISVMDALFTSTSAVCVTGLIVVDTGTYFTSFGQYIILILIQLGGLGIMTFTSYFSYFFKAGSSYQNQLLLSAMTNTEKMGEVFGTLKRILFITFLIESFGAFLIFESLRATSFPALDDKIFFSVFHSISGFCNAGFSTSQQSFYELVYRFNYPLHLTISFLIIIGGIGFPIVFNVLSSLKNYVKNLFYGVFGRQEKIRIRRIVNVNTQIVLITTFSLIVFGTVFFYIFEYNNTLAEHGFFGKIVTAFFASVTSRTAGFNTVDSSMMTIPSVLILLFLMWVGASPGSTGGGVKTSTLAIAILNFRSLAQGSQRIDVFKSEISQKSVNRAFAIIILSFIVIFVAFFSISMWDGDKGLLNILFEVVSAFSTVGLSRGITASLSEWSKFVLVITMFIGRVSMLTILIAVSKKIASQQYRYPTEEVLIN